MSRYRTKQHGYMKATDLSDDFRRLLTPPKSDRKQPPAIDNCPVCLQTFDDPRILQCKHAFCCDCLQFAINRSPKISDSDRGFECILCGHFTKVLNYSIPRGEWSAQIPKDDLHTVQLQDREHADSGNNIPAAAPDSNKQVQPDTWVLDWQRSEYPKSDIISHGMDPSKPIDHRYTGQIDDEEESNEDASKAVKPYESIIPGTSRGENYNGQYYEVEPGRYKLTRLRRNVRILEASNGEQLPRESDVTSNTEFDKDIRGKGRVSKITAATFYGEELIVFDEGLCEILLYKPDLRLKSSIRQRDIYDIAVLGSLLFMTNPDDRCIEILDLDNLLKRETIKLTMKCYGIDSFEDQLVVLLCDNDDENFHVSFLDTNGITGGNISLRLGHYQLKSPRQLAVCSLTRLVYVSDEKTGVVKCYNLDGHLNWEKVVVGAGDLTVFNGYLVVARKFTNSVDVLSGKGVYNGRMESSEYGVLSPRAISIRQDTVDLLIVDADNLMHIFTIRKHVPPETIPPPPSSCGCILT